METSKPNERGSFLFFRSFYDVLKELNETDRLKAYEQITRYAFEGVRPDNEDNMLLRVFALTWIPLLDADERRSRGGAPKGNKNAVGHGAPKGNKNASKKQTKNKQPSNNNNNNDNDINNDIDIDIVADKSATGLTPLSSLGEDRASALEGGMNENDDDWVFDPEVAEREYQEWKKQNGII